MIFLNYIIKDYLSIELLKMTISNKTLDLLKTII